jgi:hypothetical protein
MEAERFVSADVAADFLGINRKFLLSMARMGIPGAYSLGTGELRRRWVFRLSELSSGVDAKSAPPRHPPAREARYDRSIRRSSLK